MFCVQCGSQLSENSKFCPSCGCAVSNSNTAAKTGGINTSGATLVPAKCTSCGANLTVDASQPAAVCPFCNTAYVVEQAINNYYLNLSGGMNINNATFNVSGGVNVTNLMIRARDYENDGDYKAALEYYNRALDIDANLISAREGVSRVKALMADYIYLQTTVTAGFLTGMLTLKKGLLIYTNSKGKIYTYDISRIHSLSADSSTTLSFQYHGKFLPVTFDCKNAKGWKNLIENAQSGIYPEYASNSR